MFICRQKINFILHDFYEILQRYCKLVVLGTLGMSGYTHPKRYYQFVDNFRVYLQAKNQLHPPCFSGYIAKICKPLILGTLGMPGYTRSLPRWSSPCHGERAYSPRSSRVRQRGELN